tara:strand:+ start:393 stop:866 length:474 start_codon:yes stop_codon:yes gene_type:complete
MNILKAIILYVALLIGTTITAQVLTPAKWQYQLSKQDTKQGEILELIFKIKLEDTWHLFSNIQSYTLGPLPTSFEFEPNDGYQLIGDIKAIGVQNEYDKVFEVTVNYFEHTAEFRQKIKILSKNPVVKGYYEYQVCNSIDGKCILGEDDFEFNIKTN